MSVRDPSTSKLTRTETSALSAEQQVARQRRARKTAWWVAGVVVLIYLGSIFQGWFYS